MLIIFVILSQLNKVDTPVKSNLKKKKDFKIFKVLFSFSTASEFSAADFQRPICFE